MPESAAAEAPGVPPSLLLSLSGLLTCLLLLAMVFVPPPYAIESPGPTVDVLGELDGEPLIEVAEAVTYEATGSLLVTTVSVFGGPGREISLTRLVLSWLSGRDGVVPVESLYPADRTAEEIEDLLTAQMVSSQENATIAALRELGYEVPVELAVVATVAGGSAEGVLAEGDVLVAAGGVPVPSVEELSRVLRAAPSGTGLRVTVRRDGELVDLTVVTGDDGAGGSRLGVDLRLDYEVPVDVTVGIDDVGGPSAGLVFALGIIETLTPAALTGGERIAGTGTITAEGVVGPISGITKKLAAAARDDAGFFLVPLANCGDVQDAVPDGVRLVGVSTLADARAAVAAIGVGQLEVLPACAA